MLTEYKIYLDGMGHFIVNADIYKVPNTETDIECEVEIIDVKKFNPEAETYTQHAPSKDEIIKLEQQVAIKFFNALH